MNMDLLYKNLIKKEWMGITDLKKPAALLTKCYNIQNLRALSYGILCIHMAQGAAKLPEVKINGPKNWLLCLDFIFKIVLPHMRKAPFLEL